MSVHADFYEQVETYPEAVERHDIFLDAYRRHAASLPGRSLNVLDVGCGEHAVLSQGIASSDRYFGMDVKQDISAPLERYAAADLMVDELVDVFPGEQFDVIFCGEVIEHVFSPDRLLHQLASVTKPDGLIVLSTPNLAYWVNRILLPLGINPLFIENSSEKVLGRRSKKLGQGNPTQGHVRVFTHRAMLDLLAQEGFTVDGVKSVPVWNFPGDRLMIRLSPHFGPDTVYFLRPPAR